MRDNIVAELRFTAKKWKEDNQRILFTGEIDVEQALSEAADAIEQASHHADDWEKIANHWRKKYEELERQIQEET